MNIMVQARTAVSVLSVCFIILKLTHRLLQDIWTAAFHSVLETKGCLGFTSFILEQLEEVVKASILNKAAMWVEVVKTGKLLLPYVTLLSRQYECVFSAQMQWFKHRLSDDGWNLWLVFFSVNHRLFQQEDIYGPWFYVQFNRWNYWGR